jgi:TolB-like protein/Tfp pilus assembly protein PilF
MACLIEGYNYDIFISYRQKDNKGDRWVSKFVDALKTELEATFKEDISIYFDENPHDRLQETHNVDKSLEGKLKCLIFIPILSQTYCDPKSYAWQYEFLAFLRMAENDRFGKDVKLRSGNVASRMLPIRIHDQESEDIKLFEKETGSVLRALDFVFKTSTGVNRPLKAIEDHPNDNLNKTFYSDQINKVANAIKEIILGLQTEPIVSAKESVKQSEPFKEIIKEEEQTEKEKPAKLNKRKLLTGAAILAILIIVAILAYPKIFKSNTIQRLRSSGERISVAVMPFQNMTNDTTWNVWQNGIQNELINNLTNSEELQVRQIESVTGLIQSKGFTNTASLTPSVASTISKKLNASVFIIGSIKQAGNTIRVNAQLIDSKTEEIFKSFQIDGTEEKILHITDSLSALVRDLLIVSIMEKEIIRDFRQLISTKSLEAYRYYMYGNQAFYKYDNSTATEWYKKAIDIDSSFTEAIRMLAYSLGHQGFREESQKWILKNYEKRDQMPLQEKLWANILYAQRFGTTNEVIKYFKLLIASDEEMPVPHSNLGGVYMEMKLYDKAIPEFEKELEIYEKWGSKPRWGAVYENLGYAYHKTGQYKKEKKLYKIAEKDFPDGQGIIERQAALSLTVGNTNAANEYIEKYKSILKNNGVSEAEIAAALGRIYYEGGIPDKTEEYFRQALSLEPENPVRMNNLAFFLIDNDKNIMEGLDLVERALKLKPDNYSFLDCKGWGLYKEGRYQEALDILQKSWELQWGGYDHEVFLHLEKVKKAVAAQK